MSEMLRNAVQTVADRFGAKFHEELNQTILYIAPEKIGEVARALRDEFHFEMLMDITAVDYWPAMQEEGRFQVVYQLYSISNHARVTLRTIVDGRDPHLESIEGIYRNANWSEREIFDMFGIRFDGHTDLRRILMPHDWAGHPLRKDYPLGYEEIQFTFNQNEIGLHKPNPER